MTAATTGLSEEASVSASGGLGLAFAAGGAEIDNDQGLTATVSGKEHRFG